MLKKLIKGFLIFSVFNWIMAFGFLGWLGFNVISPTLEGTDVSFFDLFSDDVDPESAELIQQRISENASKLGTETGQKITSALGVLFPDPDFDWSDPTPIEYPYPSSDEVMEMINQRANESTKKALQRMEDNEAELQKAREEGLRILEESEKTNDAIKEKVLNDDNN